MRIIVTLSLAPLYPLAVVRAALCAIFNAVWFAPTRMRFTIEDVREENV